MISFGNLTCCSFGTGCMAVVADSAVVQKSLPATARLSCLPLEVSIAERRQWVECVCSPNREAVVADDLLLYGRLSSLCCQSFGTGSTAAVADKQALRIAKVSWEKLAPRRMIGSLSRASNLEQFPRSTVWQWFSAISSSELSAKSSKLSENRHRHPRCKKIIPDENTRELC
jgi:hypothetical protein